MSQSAFFCPGCSWVMTLMPASCARLNTGSSAAPSLGMTPMTSTFLAIRSSTARTCCAASSDVGAIIQELTPSSSPAFFTPFSTLSNQGMRILATMAICGGVLAASAAAGARALAAPTMAADCINVRREISRISVPSQGEWPFLARFCCSARSAKVDRPLSLSQNGPTKSRSPVAHEPPAGSTADQRDLTQGNRTGMERTRLAVIGCGFFAQNHLNSWKDLAAKGVDIVAVCDVDAAKAQAAAEKFGVPNWYSDAESLFGAHKLDLVDIVTRVDTHQALVEQAIRHRVAAIVQK